MNANEAKVFADSLRMTASLIKDDSVRSMATLLVNLSEQHQAALALHQPYSRDTQACCECSNESYVVYPCPTALALGVES